MYKTYRRFMKYFEPHNKGEGLKYPCIWIRFAIAEKEVNRNMEGTPEEYKKEIEKLIYEASKNPQKSYSLLIVFFRSKGKSEIIHQSGELYTPYKRRIRRIRRNTSKKK